MANFDVNVYIIARENSYKIGRALYGVRLIFYNAGRAPYDIVRCPVGHRPMFSYTDAGRRSVRYVTTQEKILKNRPVPGRLMCKSLKSYDVSFICDHSINRFIPSNLILFKYDKRIWYWKNVKIKKFTNLTAHTCIIFLQKRPLKNSSRKRVSPV